METKRKPLQPGTLIEWDGERAFVVADTGGPVLIVANARGYEPWEWTSDGRACTVVSLPPVTPDGRYAPLTTVWIDGVKGVVLRDDGGHSVEVMTASSRHTETWPRAGIERIEPYEAAGDPQPVESAAEPDPLDSINPKIRVRTTYVTTDGKGYPSLASAEREQARIDLIEVVAAELSGGSAGTLALAAGVLVRRAPAVMAILARATQFGGEDE